MKIKKPFFFILGIIMFAILIVDLIKSDNWCIIFINMIAVIGNFFLSFRD